MGTLDIASAAVKLLYISVSFWMTQPATDIVVPDQGLGLEYWIMSPYLNFYVTLEAKVEFFN